jgi:predicted permease
MGVLDEIRENLRYGLRTHLRTPGVTLVALLTLALGIGAPTLIFSVLDATMIRPLPFQDAGRLMELQNVSINRQTGRGHGPLLTTADVRSLHVFQHVVAYGAGGLNLSNGNTVERIAAAKVTPGFFGTLGVRLVTGRGFEPEEAVPYGPLVTIISRALWRERFGADRTLSDARIILNGRGYQVVGVAPRGFAFPAGASVWIPMSRPWTAASDDPFGQSITVIGRLAPGVSLEAARSGVTNLFRARGRRARAVFAPRVRSLRSMLVGDRRPTLLMLLCATGLVLLIATANVANLVLSRAIGRSREVAVRATLGATPARVARQLLLENILLALLGGAVGTGLAFAGTHELRSLVPAGLVGLASLQVNVRVLGFALILTLGTGLALGLLPARSASRWDVGEVMKSAGTGTTTGGASSRLRRSLLLGEIALTVMLLVGSGLMLRSLHALLSTETGLRVRNVATLEVALAATDYGTRGAKRRFYSRVIHELDAMPGVAASAWVNQLPLRTGQSGFRFPIYPEGHPLARGDVEREPELIAAMWDYFHAMGIQILSGRAPRASMDTTHLRFAEAAVNQRLARLDWPGSDPIGKRLLMNGGVSLKVVGVVADVRQTSLTSTLVPQVYVPFLQRPYSSATLVARGTMSASVLEQRLVQAVHDVAPEQAVYGVRTMDDVIAHAIQPRPMNTDLVTAFGLLALLVAGVGVYGVVAFGVARRTQEIGIRMALGADARRVRKDVLHDALGLAFGGSVLGLGGAWVLSRVLRSFLYGVTPTDPISFAVAPLIVLATTALAASMPAYRATQVHPTDAIREA